MREREMRDRVPYRQWADKGHLELTPGSAISMAHVTARVIEIAKRFDAQRVSFDRWGSAAVSQDLTAAGLPMVELGQGFASMSAPTKALQVAILRGELEHDGSSLLRWQAANCTVASDVTGNIKPVKQDRFKHRKHIDSIVAAVMAMDGYERATPQGSMQGFLEHPLIFD